MYFLNVLALFLLFNFTLGSFAPYYDLAKADEYFADFIKKYDRKYESIEEFRKRFEIFKKRLEKLNEWNENNKYKEGGYIINQFTDKEDNESCLFPSTIQNTTKVIQVEKKYILNAPDELDYRNNNLVTEVKNQKECKDCYIFAAIGTIEGIHAKNSGGDLQSLSEQQILDCTDADCEKGGLPDVAINNMAGKKIMTEAEYPYEGSKGSCRNDDPNKGTVKVNSATVIDTPDIETLKGALVQNGAPLAVAMFASLSLNACSGPIVCSPTDCEPGVNHAVLLIGYGKENNIDEEVIVLLEDSELRELIPKIGPRLKLKNYIKSLKQDKQPVLDEAETTRSVSSLSEISSEVSAGIDTNKGLECEVSAEIGISEGLPCGDLNAVSEKVY